MAEDEKRPATAIQKRTKEETQHALQRVAHGKAPNEEVYWCMSCGFAKDPNDPSKVEYPKGLTLQFSPDEIEALGGDLTAYSGPCPCCEFMSLVPMDKFTGQSIHQMARENREVENREMAKAFVDVVKEEIAGGSIFSGGMADPTASAAPPGQHDHLRDADDVEDDDRRGR